MKSLLLSLICLSLLLSHGLGGEQQVSAGDKVEIDPLAKRAAIRTELLKFTPLGSSSKEVIEFLKTRLLKKGDPEPVLENHPALGPSAEEAPKRGVKVLTLDLGDYTANTILLTLSPPLPIQESMIAQWAFDEHDRLIELFLDRKLEQ